jgi:hypothetical protein
MALRIIHDSNNREFYCIIEGSKCFLSYNEVPPSGLDIYQTYVSPELRNRGIAEKLLLAVVKYAEISGKKIISSCSYTEHYFGRHPEYNDILG